MCSVVKYAFSHSENQQEPGDRNEEIVRQRKLPSDKDQKRAANQAQASIVDRCHVTAAEKDASNGAHREFEDAPDNTQMTDVSAQRLTAGMKNQRNCCRAENYDAN